jgi:methionine-rich copper-binding protein CopC
LLTEPGFTEEFDLVVDEITDEYLRNEIQGAERERVEKYFLRSAERQEKLRFASELLHQAEVERGNATNVQTVIAREPGFGDRLRAFWRGQSFARVGAMAAAVVVFGVILYLAWPRTDRVTGTYASLNLRISSSNRSEGAAPARVKLEPGIAGLKINLTLPEHAPAAKSFRARLIDENRVEKEVDVTQENDGKLTVTVPAPLKPGTYTIQLFAEKADGTRERVRGSYFFTIE